ncbi:hypothetical protein LJB93_03065 [Desulfovibrio sp. OttesenSCG-928-F07]|nr:hypothetical protein [Desulfovibrio sp. OttesenSCG-928-F07]
MASILDYYAMGNDLQALENMFAQQNAEQTENWQLWPIPLTEYVHERTKSRKPQLEEFTSGLKRVPGRTARIGVNALSSIPDLPIHLLNSVNGFAGGDPNYFKTFSGLGNDALDFVGAGKPENELEQRLDNIGSMLGGGGATIGAGKLMAKGGKVLSDTVAQGVGRTLAANPGAQAASTITGAGAQQYLDHIGASPAVQMVGGLAGGFVPVPAQAAYNVGSAAKNQIIRPLTNGGRETLAGKALNDIYGNNPHFADNISSMLPDAEIIPGSYPTTAQLTGNPNAAALEKGLRSSGLHGQGFNVRNAEQAAARETFLQDGLSVLESSPGAASLELRPEMGQNIRKAYDDVYAAARAKTSDAYNTIDPNNASAFDSRPLVDEMDNIIGKYYGQFGGKPDAEISAVRNELYNLASGQYAARNQASGLEAMNKAIATQSDVLHAMQRPDVGDIGFYWGFPGKGAKLKEGYGVSHLIGRRALEGQNGEDVARKIVDVLAYGKAGKPYGPTDGLRRNISYDGHTAVLSLLKDKGKETWLLTGWKDDIITSAGAKEAVNANSSYAQRPSGIQSAMGAAEGNTNISQLLQNDNTMLPYQELQRLRSRLSNVSSQAAQGQDNVTSSVAGKMRGIIDEAIENAGEAFTPEQAAQWQNAKNLRIAQGQNFESGANRILSKKGNTAGGQGIEASAIPGNYFKPGKGGYEAAQDFLRSAGQRPEARATLQDYALAEFRDVLTKNGRLNTNGAQEWVKKHSGALLAFPELRQKIDGILGALSRDVGRQRAVDRVKRDNSTVTPNLLDVLESMSVGEPLQHLPVVNSIFGNAKQSIQNYIADAALDPAEAVRLLRKAPKKTKSILSAFEDSLKAMPNIVSQTYRQNILDVLEQQ